MVLWLTALAMLGALGSTARGETFRLSIGAGHPAEAAVWITMMRDFFAAEVAKRAEKAGHKIDWVSAYGGSVCKLGECLEAVESGLLDVGELQVPFEPTKLVAHNFGYFVPFAAPDPVQAARAARKVYDTVPGLKSILENKYNQIFLGVGTVGNYGLVTTFPWERVEQLKSHKIAAAGPNIPWLQAVGAVPVQSSLNEAYNAMQSGVYEGWVMFADATVGFKLHEVAKNFTETGFGAVPTTVITVNKATWRKLPKEIQNIMLEVGKEYTEVEAKAVVEKAQRSIATMKAAGVNVRYLSEAERVQWANALPDIANQRAAEIKKAGQPPEAIAVYLQALREAGVKMPREWKVQ
jgi:TRAP-type C4-dicarboxylate transport system substrate-binding protein